MNPELRDRIEDVFSYDAEDQGHLGILRQYMARIEPRMEEILASRDACYRYMLAGLFISYRAANFQGMNIDTTVAEPVGGSYTDERVKTFGEISGTVIRSNAEYRDLIGLNPYLWLTLGMGRMLARFVLKGYAKAPGSFLSCGEGDVAE